MREPLHFHCPNCSTPLRVKDPLSLRRDARCPECQAPILVVEKEGTFRVTLGPVSSAEPATKPRTPASAVSNALPRPSEPKPPGRRPLEAGAILEKPGKKSNRSIWRSRPLIIGWILAGGLSLVLVWFAFFHKRTSPSSPGDVTVADTPPSSEVGALEPSVDEEDPIAPLISTTDDTVDSPMTTVEIVSIEDAEPGPIDDEEADPPLLPEFGPENVIRKVDIAQSLQQPIVGFELSPARPLSELLPGLAELVGAPLLIAPDAEVSPASLKTPIQLRLQETTVGAILEALLKPAGLTYQIESDHVRIVPRG